MYMNVLYTTSSGRTTTESEDSTVSLRWSDHYVHPIACATVTMYMFRSALSLNQSSSSTSSSHPSESSNSWASFFDKSRESLARLLSTDGLTMALKYNQSSFAKCDVTPPSLDRQHSYFTRQDGSRTDATAVLASVASRTASPRRKSNMSGSDTTPLPSPTESVQSERRTSWEDCRQQRDGYISFPDFDQLRAEHETKGT